jgi:hypothetical protein
MRNGIFALVTAVITLAAGAPQAHAAAVKHIPVAARGCIPTLTLDKAKEEIVRFNLKTIGAKPEEVKALGTSLFWIKTLNGGRVLDKAEGRNFPYGFTFRDGHRWSSQGARTIYISRWGHRKFGENAAQLVHELGHYVGNNGAYEDFRHYVGGRKCVVSGYARKNGNEHFAEVFAAFVTAPQLLKNNRSRGCQLAYEYFEQEMFAKGSLARKCMNGRMSAEQVKDIIAPNRPAAAKPAPAKPAPAPAASPAPKSDKD